MATRVAIYARVSTDDKGQDPENQLRQLREWCGRMGYPVVREYVEQENGGKGVEYRKALAEMFEGATRREFDLFWCGRSTASVARAWPRRLRICSALLRTASHSGRSPKSIFRRRTSSSATSCSPCLPRSPSSSARRSVSARRRGSSGRAPAARSSGGRNLAMVIARGCARLSMSVRAGTQ